MTALVGAVVAVHFGLLLYLVVGGFLALRWPRTVVAHVALACWAVITSFAQIPCPITMLEDALRARAGMPALEGGFVEAYIVSAGNALGSLNALRLMAFTLIAVSWVVLVRRRRAGGQPSSTRRSHASRQ